MEKINLDNEETIRNGQIKINIGLAIIVLSPLFGTILFYIYKELVGGMISTDGAIEMFWFSCILVMALLGIAIVFIASIQILFTQRDVNK